VTEYQSTNAGMVGWVHVIPLVDEAAMAVGL